MVMLRVAPVAMPLGAKGLPEMVSGQRARARPEDLVIVLLGHEPIGTESLAKRDARVRRGVILILVIVLGQVPPVATECVARVHAEILPAAMALEAATRGLVHPAIGMTETMRHAMMIPP
jgi:hypothetical protein